ncbi:hypothetical protein [Bacteroides sp. UBA939]|uniref:hypothetical protein n=1 Tax=Bacteroides sp. UBA939 TaxID=1946092 RepID=UPI0025B7CE3E|nr:hypothetical protein [Bacteroides sp. UBA939]
MTKASHNEQGYFQRMLRISQILFSVWFQSVCQGTPIDHPFLSTGISIDHNFSSNNNGDSSLQLSHTLSYNIQLQQRNQNLTSRLLNNQ